MDNMVGVALAVNSPVCFSIAVNFYLSFELKHEFYCVFDGAIIISPPPRKLCDTYLPVDKISQTVRNRFSLHFQFTLIDLNVQNKVTRVLYEA